MAQLVARAVRDCEVVGSNPITQTTKVLLTQNGRRSFGQKPQRLRLQIRSPRPYKDYTFDTNLIIKEPRFIGVLLGFVYDYYHTIKDKDEHYALLL